MRRVRALRAAGHLPEDPGLQAWSQVRRPLGGRRSGPRPRSGKAAGRCSRMRSGKLPTHIRPPMPDILTDAVQQLRHDRRLQLHRSHRQPPEGFGLLRLLPFFSPFLCWFFTVLAHSFRALNSRKHPSSERGSAVGTNKKTPLRGVDYRPGRN